MDRIRSGRCGDIISVVCLGLLIEGYGMEMQCAGEAGEADG